MTEVIKKIYRKDINSCLNGIQDILGFTYSAFAPFTKNKKIIQKFWKKQDIQHIFIKKK